VAHGVDDKSAEIVRSEFPTLLVPWYAPVSEGYLHVAVGRTGAKNVRVETTTVPTAAWKDGVQLSTVRFLVRWD
jgi:hypothetical protein